jgi:hypothetical protein
MLSTTIVKSVILLQSLWRRSIIDFLFQGLVGVWYLPRRWFSPGTQVFVTKTTDRHDMAEILLKVAVNTIPPLTPEKENQLYCDAKDFAAVSRT